jgi:hypothetical protein
MQEPVREIIFMHFLPACCAVPKKRGSGATRCIVRQGGSGGVLPICKKRGTWGYLHLNFSLLPRFHTLRQYKKSGLTPSDPTSFFAELYG